MKKIIVTNAGRSTAINFCRSLRLAPEKYEIIGLEQSKYSILNAEVDQKILCPSGDSEYYLPFLKDVIKNTKADLLYPSKTNEELWLISRERNNLGIKTFLPEDDVIQIFEDKFATNDYLKRTGIKVPETFLINNENDLKKAFEILKNGVWLRAVKGCGGKGSMPTKSFDMAKAWIDRFNGWGCFTASERLTDKTATWTGIWKDGNLVVSQIRKRLYWEYSYLAPSGVTGITGAQVTAKDKIIDEIALKSIFAITGKPHGIVSVDFTYDYDGLPNPTEIQASRFYTSTYFLAKAGLNLPYIFIKLAFDEKIEEFEEKFSPLEEGLLWVKYVDCLPQLSSVQEVSAYESTLDKWIQQYGRTR